MTDAQLAALGITVEEKGDKRFYRCPALFGAAPTCIIVTLYRPSKHIPYVHVMWSAGLYSIMPDRSPGPREGLAHAQALAAALADAIEVGQRWEAEYAEELKGG